MSRQKNYIAGLSSGYVLSAAIMLVGLWLTPFTLRFLDREEYAVFSLANDVIMWLALLDLGITAGLRAKAAQLAGRPDPQALNELASSAFYAQMVVVAVVILAGSVIALLFPAFFPVRPDLQSDSRGVMLLLALGSAMSIGTQTFSALLVAHQQIHVDNAIALFNLALRTVITVLMLLMGYGLYSLAVANIAAKLVSGALAVFRVYRFLPGLRIRWTLASWTTFKQVGSLGMWFSVGGMAGIIMTTLGSILTAKLVSVEMVTTMSLSNRLYALAIGLLAQITDNARPMLGQLIGQKKRDEAYAVYRQLVLLSAGFGLVTAAAMWAANRSFVTWWVGAPNYGSVGLDVSLALGLAIQTWILPSRAMLTADLSVKPQSIVRMVEGGLGVVLAFVLGRQFGLVGIAAGTALGAIATSSWYLPKLVSQRFREPHQPGIGRDMTRLAVLLCVVVPGAIVAREVCTPLGGIWGAGLAVVMVSALGSTAIWTVVLDPSLKLKARQAIGIARSTWRRPRAIVNGGVI